MSLFTPINNAVNKQEFKISNLELAQWMNAIRELKSHDDRTRALDALWLGQLASKGWLVNHITNFIDPKVPVNIYIFGGWIGILSNMLFQHESMNISKIRSIDIDPWCEPIADTVNKRFEMDDWRFKAVTADMGTYHYQSDITPHVVINTSTEHVTQDVYDSWYSKIPVGTLVLIQGNNFFSCDEHIRCSKSLDEFKIQNKVINEYWSGTLETNMYTRYMCIWRKQ
jgi:hypothetical protein